MENNLKKSIQETLAYFDLADYPLTKEELFAYLWRSPLLSYENFLKELDILMSLDIISRGVEEKFGYYFLIGREKILENRRRCLVISEIKMKIAERAVKKIRSVPFLWAVFACNSVGAGQARDDSDIDFFIVTAPGRIWIVRFFCNFILRLWGMRTYGEKIKNKICLSFFVDSEHLNLSELRVVEDDIHFAYWLHQMAPVYDSDNWYDKFLNDNDWTDKFLSNIKKFVKGGYSRQTLDGKAGKILEKNLGKNVAGFVWQFNRTTGQTISVGENEI